MQSLFASDPANTAYIKSVAAIVGFDNWITSQTLPPNFGYGNYQQAYNAFDQTKVHGMRWFNAVYPACIEISQQIEQADSTFTPGLDTLIALAGQLQSRPDDQKLHQQIGLAAASLSGSVTTLANQIEKVVGALQTSAVTMTGDTHVLLGEGRQMSNDWHMLSVRYGQLSGQLQALQNATSPDKRAIVDCARELEVCGGAMRTIESLGHLYDPCTQSASGAAQGLSFMASYWSQVQKGAQCVIETLGKVASAPVAIVKTDLGAAQQGWKQTLTLAQATNAHAAAMNLAGPAIARL